MLQRHATPSSTILHRNNILSIGQRLCEIANRADDVFVAVNAERDHGDEAEGEPGVALDDSGGVVALEGKGNVSYCGW